MENDKRKDNFMSLFLMNQKRIYSFILMCIPNRTDADDLLQETATWMWLNFHKYEEGTSFGAWGVSVARYKILNFCRTTKNKKLVFDEDIIELIDEQSAKAVEKVDIRVDALRKCLSRIPEKDRWIIALHYEKSYTIQKISQLIERPASGLYKKMAKLHDLLLHCTRRTIAMESIDD